MKRRFATITAAAALFLALMPGVIGAAANPNAEVEALVRAAFADAPDMIAVAKCESGFRQFNADGTPLHGGGGGKYVGIFQISEAVHTARAARLGHDINTIAGNIAFSRLLYDEQGVVPWISCVPKRAPTSVDTPMAVTTPAADSTPNAAALPVLTANLRVGMSHPQVSTLQQLLNASGYSVAAGGPGSPGNETTRFGALTRAAVRKFQCDKGIACDGDEASTGYGNVGPKTRTALNVLRAQLQK